MKNEEKDSALKESAEILRDEFLKANHSKEITLKSFEDIMSLFISLEDAIYDKKTYEMLSEENKEIFHKFFKQTKYLYNLNKEASTKTKEAERITKEIKQEHKSILNHTKNISQKKKELFIDNPKIYKILNYNVFYRINIISSSTDCI